MGRPLNSRRGQRVQENKRCCKIRPRTVVDIAALCLMFYTGLVPLFLVQKNASKLDAFKTSSSHIKLQPDAPLDRSLTRGQHGLPMSETPALVGARRGHVDCDTDVDGLVSYWNDPQGDRDRSFKSPFASVDDKVRYLTFEPDRGGWNNIRMSLENMIVFAAASGRVLVLPPDQPIYLLKRDAKRKQRGFADFFNLHSASFNKLVRVMTTKEFLERGGGKSDNALKKVEDSCEHRNKSEFSCLRLYEYYSSAGVVPGLHGEKQCLIFHQGYLGGNPLDHLETARVKKFCGTREPVYYDKTMRDAPHLHFATSDKEHRLLVHFYAFQFFLDPTIDNFFKRFVRDHVRYRDSLFCAAGKIVMALQKEGQKLGFQIGDDGGGGFSSMHIRRGDFQWKAMKISSEEWYENTKDIFHPKEVLYIATDEGNRTFFDPIAKYHDLKFLDDFRDVAGLDTIPDPNYMSMIDAIVAAGGRMFVGTYFSSFSAYIGRLRGYAGKAGREMWHGQKQHKTATHEWVYPQSSYSAREFPIGWIGIDGDVEVNALI